MNVIYILWLRQIKRYWRSKARIVGSLGQPLLFLLALGYGLGPIFQKAGGGNYIQFLAPGVVAMSILFTAVFSGIEIIWDKQFGFLKETLVAPVSRFQIMLGRTLGGATTSMFQGIIVIIIASIFGFKLSWGGLIPALFLMLLIALLFTAFGTAIASRLNDMQGFQLIMNFVIMPLYFLSGSLFPLTSLNKTLTVITRLNPLSYGIDGLRNTLIHQAHFALSTDFLVLGIISLALIAIGGWLFSGIEV